MSYLKLQSLIPSLLKDESGTNAVEYALTMVFGAVFIIGALLKLGPALNTPFTDVMVCMTDVVNCAPIIDGGDIGGSNGSGLGDGTNPGLGSGQNNSPNEGVNNPGGQRAVEVRGGGTARRPLARD